VASPERRAGQDLLDRPSVSEAMTTQPPPRLSLVTLGVADVERATAFYRALGWDPSSASVPGEVTFFDTQGGLLALWGVAELAMDSAVPAAEPGAVALAINVESRDAVDEALARAVASGGRISRAAQATDWGGYNGYFRDPDGHVWEVAHNPFWPISADGRPQLP
jgi:predicted lactoylglutathione lyase